MDLSGLSPDKAPPVEAPLALFYLMPLFIGLAGMVLLWQGDQVLASRWAPATLAATHFIVLGALAPVMCGALLQISPVLLGAPFPRVRLIALLTATGLGVGSLLIGSGFLTGLPVLLVAAGVAAASGLAVFLVAAQLVLRGAGGRMETRWAVRLATAALGVTLLLGLSLAAARMGWLHLPQHLLLVDTHVAWGLGGWVGLLLAGIGMEIIPLFYIAPAFSRWIKRTLPIAVFAILIGLTALALQTSASMALLKTLMLALFVAHLVYNLAALAVQRRRQRPQRDANLWLWQLSHVGVLAAFVAWLVGYSPSQVGVLLLGAALSFVVGSMLKIVPFLSWLDLQQRRIAGRHVKVTLPRLRALLPTRTANAVGLTLAAAIVAVAAAPLAPLLTRVGGLLLVVCAVLLGYALASAARQRHAVIRQFDASGPAR